MNCNRTRVKRLQETVMPHRGPPLGPCYHCTPCNLTYLSIRRVSRGYRYETRLGPPVLRLFSWVPSVPPANTNRLTPQAQATTCFTSLSIYYHNHPTFLFGNTRVQRLLQCCIITIHSYSLNVAFRSISAETDTFE